MPVPSRQAVLSSMTTHKPQHRVPNVAMALDNQHDRASDEQATIQGIAEHLQREWPDTTISELWI